MLSTYQVVYKSLPVLVEVEEKPSWIQMEPLTVTLKIVLCKSKQRFRDAAFRAGVGAVSAPALTQELLLFLSPVSVIKDPYWCLLLPGILSSFRGGQKQRWQKLEDPISFVQPESQHKDRRRNNLQACCDHRTPSPGSIVPIHRLWWDRESIISKVGVNQQSCLHL